MALAPGAAAKPSRFARPPSSVMLRMTPSPAKREKGSGFAQQKIDERPIVGDPVFQEVLESAFAKNAVSKFFRAQPFEIPRFAQIKVCEKLQAFGN
ncbi:MAG: hypothetical protein ABSE69_13215 [Roseiarcus sp.]